MGPVNLGDGGEMSKSYCPSASICQLLTACSCERLDPDWQSLPTAAYVHDVRRPRQERRCVPSDQEELRHSFRRRITSSPVQTRPVSVTTVHF